MFVDCLKELPATLLLRPLNVETLATSIYQYASRGSFEEGALAALLIVAASIGPVAWLTRFSDVPERAGRTVDADLDRAREPAEAGRAGERLECRVALLLGEGKTRLGVASLGGLVADQERDRRPCVAGGLAGGERVRDQAPASGRARDRPAGDATCSISQSSLAALNPAARRNRRRAGTSRDRSAALIPASRRPPLRARPPAAQACRATATRTTPRPAAIDLGDDELRRMPPGSLPRAMAMPLRRNARHLRLRPAERDVEPAARQRAALRRQDRMRA